jgi:hypothetical protein
MSRQHVVSFLLSNFLKEKRKDSKIAQTSFWMLEELKSNPKIIINQIDLG